MSITHEPAGRGWRNRSKVALACAVVSATAMLPVACGVPGEADGVAQPKATQPTATVSPTPGVDDATAARQAYLAYDKAGVDKNVAAAVALLSESSKQYHENLRTLALTANKAKLSEEPVVDQITVLQMRHFASPEVLRTGDLEALIEASMKGAAGLPADTGVSPADLLQAKVTVNGDVATMADPADPETPIRLVREGGGWKVDEASHRAGMSEAVDGLMELSGASEAEFVEQAVAEIAGSPAKMRKLWKPVGTGTA